MSLTLHTAKGDSRAIACLVTAKYAGVAVNVNALSAEKLAGLGNDDAYKALNPTAKAPTLETADGSVWMANSICRYLARSAPASNLLGRSFQEQSQVDQWLDFSLNELEVPSVLLVGPIIGTITGATAESYKEAEKVMKAALAALNSHLALRTYVVGQRLTIADIVLAAALFYPMKFAMDKGFRKPYSNVSRWFSLITDQDNFKAVAGDVTLCKKRAKLNLPKAGGAAKAAPKAAPKAAAKQEEKKELSAKDILKKQPKSSWDVEPWKKVYSNAPKNEEGKAQIMDQFCSELDQANWGVWLCDYNYNDDNTILWMTGNLVGGFSERFDEVRKWLFGTVAVLTKQPGEGGKGNIILRGAVVMRHATEGANLLMKANPEAEYWTWTKVDVSTAEGKAKLTERWSKIYEGNVTSDGLHVYDAVEIK